ncbi:hypothetical protein HPB51_022484 [Rhipicephalus microplus]|uniref:Uncharacterized protein n=1 Tax=Rhipicephalus microplus TaxID=6941 RepID=A0A9J6D761_RHIMP|nr:hypothetical protein HPB51_022484 [Rhipicephalus microplus]
MSGIGAYQKSHVWLLNMKTDEAKKTLLDAGLLSVKYWPCLVVDPERQEVRLKLHCVAFDVHAATARRAFRQYGEAKEVISDKRRDEDFEGVESTTRFVRLLLNDGVTTDRIPLRCVSGAAQHWRSYLEEHRCACVAGTLDTLVATAGGLGALVVVL